MRAEKNLDDWVQFLFLHTFSWVVALLLLFTSLVMSYLLMLPVSLLILIIKLSWLGSAKNCLRPIVNNALPYTDLAVQRYWKNNAGFYWIIGLLDFLQLDTNL